VIRTFEALAIPEDARAGFEEIVCSTPEDLEAGIDPAGRDGRATPIRESALARALPVHIWIGSARPTQEGER
jgi:hypothetical protein